MRDTGPLKHDPLQGSNGRHGRSATVVEHESSYDRTPAPRPRSLFPQDVVIVTARSDPGQATAISSGIRDIRETARRLGVSPEQVPRDDAYDAVFSPAALGLGRRSVFEDPPDLDLAPAFDPSGTARVERYGAPGVPRHPRWVGVVLLAVGTVFGAALVLTGIVVLRDGGTDEGPPLARAAAAPAVPAVIPASSQLAVGVGTPAAVTPVTPVPGVEPPPEARSAPEPSRVRKRARSRRARRVRRETGVADARRSTEEPRAETTVPVPRPVVRSTASEEPRAEESRAAAPEPSAPRRAVTIGSLLAGLRAKAAMDAPKVEAIPRVLPTELSVPQLQRSLARARLAIRRCYRRFGANGAARLRMTIRGRDGAVVAARVGGSLANSQTGRCLVAMARGLRFGRFSKRVQHFSYPVFFR